MKKNAVTPPPENPPSRLQVLGTCVLLLAAVALTYGNSLEAPFNYDDEATIRHDIGLEGERFYDWHPLRYRHLFYLTLAWNHALGGLDPFGYHVFNVLLHACSSLALLMIAFLTLDRGLGWGRRTAFSIAALTALIFALNPVHSEAVTYVSGRASGLSGLFCLLSLLAFIAASLKSSGSGWRGVTLYAGSLLGFFGALLSKETSAVLPLLLFVYDALFMRGAAFKPFRQRLYGFYLPVLCAGLALLFLSPDLRAQLGQWLPRIDVSYAGMQTAVVAYAIKLFFWPVNLTFDYDFTSGFFSYGIVLWIGVVLLLFGIHAGLRERANAHLLVIFALLWFLIGLAPTNSLLPRPDLLSERNLYLPSVGVSLLLAAWVHGLFGGRDAAHSRMRGWGIACAAVLLVSFAALLIHRNGLYTSNVRLWEDALKKSPGKLRALHNLSHFYLRDKNYDRALVTLTQLAASKASPFYLSFAHNNLGSLHTHFGNARQAEHEFKAAIASDPTIPTGHFNLASLYASTGRYEEARAHYAMAEERYTLYRWGYAQPPELALNRAKVDVKLGLLEEAESLLTGFLQKVPQSADGLLLLGHIFNATGRKERAIETYRKVSGPPGKRSRALNNLGILMIEKGKMKEAQAEFGRALDLDPNLADAHYNLATLLTQSDRDRDKARSHLQAALSLTHDPQRRKRLQAQLAALAQKTPDPDGE